jgi:hypothetical protein
MTPTKESFLIWACIGFIVALVGYYYAMPNPFFTNLQELIKNIILIVSFVSLILTPLFAYKLISVEQTKTNAIAGFIWGVSITPVIVNILNKIQSS